VFFLRLAVRAICISVTADALPLPPTDMAHDACVAGFTGGGAIAGGVVGGVGGGVVGGVLGGVTGGAGGSLVAPGVGTVGGAVLGGTAGAETGSTIGTGVGTLAGSAAGYVVGNIVCAQSGGPRGGGSNQSENAKFAEAVRRIERALGKKLTPDQMRRLHDLISGQGLGLDEIVQLGIGLFR